MSTSRRTPGETIVTGHGGRGSPVGPSGSTHSSQPQGSTLPQGRPQGLSGLSPAGYPTPPAPTLW